MKRYDSYKPSGISWIAEIPSHWNVVAWRSILKEHTETNNPIVTRELLALSYALGVTRYSDKKYNMDRVKEDFSQYKIVHENDFVISPNDIIKGSAFRSKYYGCISPMYLTYHSLSGDMTELEFLGFYIRTRQVGREFFSLAKGLIGSVSENGKYVTRRMTVGRNEINNFRIVLPPTNEQKQIVDFLTRKTTLIEAQQQEREREIQLLNELKQAEIANVVLRGLNPDAPTKQAQAIQFGKIPAHWEERKIQYCFSERSQKGFPNEPMLCATQSQGVIPQSMYANRVVVVNKDFDKQKLVKVGDFVISLRSFEGGIEYAYYQGIISAAYTILTPKEVENSEYFKHLFKSFNFIQLLQTCVTGIREGQNINYPFLSKHFIPVPPIEEQKAIVEYIRKKNSAIDDMIANLRAEIDTLTEYKQRLIADVVTGQVDVRNL